MRFSYVLTAVCILSACGPDISCPPNDNSIGCVRGATIVVDESRLPVKQDGLLEEIDRLVIASAKVWQPPDIRGWTITIQGSWFACHTAEGPVFTHGCTYTDGRVFIAPDGAFPRCTAVTLLHELGHVTGVYNHDDTRFADAELLKAQECS